MICARLLAGKKYISKSTPVIRRILWICTSHLSRRVPTKGAVNLMYICEPGRCNAYRYGVWRSSQPLVNHVNCFSKFAASIYVFGNVTRTCTRNNLMPKENSVPAFGAEHCFQFFTFGWRSLNLPMCGFFDAYYPRRIVFRSGVVGIGITPRGVFRSALPSSWLLLLRLPAFPK